jgi:Flp pilus assembly protein TadD
MAMTMPKTRRANLRNDLAGTCGWIALALALAGCATPAPSVQELANVPKSPEAAKASDVVPTASNASTNLPTDVASAIRQAQLQRTSGDLTGSARTLGQLVLVAPDDPRVLGEYGKTLAAEGNANDSLAFLKRAISMQPNDWMLYSALGVANDEKGDYPAAQASYLRALQLKPGDPTVLSNYGLSRMLAGDLAGAEQALTQAQQAGATYPKIASNLELVRSLRTQQSATAPAAMVASVKPNSGTVVMQALPAKTTQQEQATTRVPLQAVTSTPIPAPSAQTAPASPAVAALRNDPSVMMAPLPQSDKADDKPKASAPPRAIAPKMAKSDTLASADTTATLRLSTGD